METSCLLCLVLLLLNVPLRSQDSFGLYQSIFVSIVPVVSRVLSPNQFEGLEVLMRL